MTIRQTILQIFSMFPFREARKLQSKWLLAFMFLCGASFAHAATFTVLNTNDSGPGSLREALLLANVNGQPDTVVFDSVVFATPKTIVLTSGMLMIERDNEVNMPPRSLTLIGPGANLLTISGNNVSRVLSLELQSKAIISGIRVTGGNGVGGPDYFGAGGGILVKGGFTGEDLLTLRDSILTGNSSTGLGGGLTIYGVASITNCTISSNVAAFGGGLAMGASSTVKVVNSTISGNSSGGLGGGLHNNSAVLDLVNTTVAFNTGTMGNSGGGGIYETSQSPFNVVTRLRNSIVANNRLGLTGSAEDLNGILRSEGHNIIGSTSGILGILGTTTGNQLNTNPQIDPVLQLNGGNTPTHALLATSTAIDSGNNCVLSTPAMGGCLDPNITHDQRGVVRPQDGNGDGNPVVDIGPYELLASVVAPPATPDLLPASDSGSSSSDNVTNIRNLNFSVGSIIAGATVEFSRDATLISSLVASGTSIDLNDPNAPANGNFTYFVRQRVGTDWSPYSSLIVTVDTIAPTVTVNQAATQADPTAILPLIFTATMSEPVIGFDQSDISLVGSNANVSNAVVDVTSPPSPFSVQINGISGIGTVVASIAANQFQDIAGNSNSASTSVDNIVTYDPSPPSPYELLRVDPHFATGRGFDDDVLDILQQPDGKVIAVGQFVSGVGFPFKRIIRLDVNGNADTTFNPGSGANGEIRSVALQNDGKIIVGGSFTTFDGVARGKVARLMPDGSLDASFANGAGVPAGQMINVVNVTSDGKVLIGGDFSSYDGVSVNRLAQLNSDGSLDQSFLGGSNFGSGAIYFAEIQSDGNILAGGSGFQQTASLLRLQPSGAIDTSFAGRTGNFRAAAVGGGSIYVGGPSIVIKLNTNGTTDASFATSAINQVTGIVIQNDGKVVMSGDFSQGTISTITRINSDGSVDASFTKTESDPMNAVILTPDNKIIGGGYLRQQNTSIGGAHRAGVRRLNSDGTRDNSYLTRNGSSNVALSRVLPLPDGKILVAGDFTTLGGIDRIRFGRLNSDGTQDGSFVPAVNNMSAFASQLDGLIIVGGNRFIPEGTHPIRRLNEDGSIDPSFVAECTTPTGAASNVRSIAVQPDGKVIVVGSFETVNGQAKKSIVRLNSNGTIDNTFTIDMVFTSADIKQVIIKPDGKILIHGRLFSLSPFHIVAQLRSNGTTEWLHEASHTASDLSIQSDGRVLVAGAFTSVGGVAASKVARINVNGSVDAAFTPPVFGPSNTTVATILALNNGKMLVGGGFNLVNGVSVPSGLIRLLSDGRVDPSFTTSSTNVLSIHSLAMQADGKVIFAGGFDSAHGVLRDNISRLLPMTRPKGAVADFDGDQKTDLSIFRPNGGSSEWWWLKSGNGSNAAVVFGSNTDTIVPADYTGDGKTDIAFWRPSNGNWFVLRSEDFSFFAAPFGSTGDTPVPADYDADGKADLAVFRESAVTWYINRSSGGTDIIPFGAAGDKPVPGDFDGDGRGDLAVFRPNGATGTEWWVRRSSNGTSFALQFGTPTDKAVSGDYTGDGKTDVAFWRPGNGNWFVLRSEDFSFFAFPFGANGDTPVPGDYDGDGRWDAGVFRSSNNTWYIQRSTAGTLIQTFGQTGDMPLPNAYIR